MISATLIILAAIFKSIADTLLHHFDSSVFKNLSAKFWNPAVSSGKRLLPFTKYRVDAWHLANSGMIVSFILSGYLHLAHFQWDYEITIQWYWQVVIAGVLFNIIFSLFYDKLLRRR